MSLTTNDWVVILKCAAEVSWPDTRTDEAAASEFAMRWASERPDDGYVDVLALLLERLKQHGESTTLTPDDLLATALGFQLTPQKWPQMLRAAAGLAVDLFRLQAPNN